MTDAPVTPSASQSPQEIPPVERQVAVDMIRRSLPALPVVIALGALFWGVSGALSTGYAIGLVLLNFIISAVALTWAASRSVITLMVVALFGFLVRLGLIAAAVLLVKDQWWVDLVPLGFTLVITHLGLLVWEASHVSTALAYPGLKPAKG